MHKARLTNIMVLQEFTADAEQAVGVDIIGGDRNDFQTLVHSPGIL